MSVYDGNFRGFISGKNCSRNVQVFNLFCQRITEKSVLDEPLRLRDVFWCDFLQNFKLPRRIPTHDAEHGGDLYTANPTGIGNGNALDNLDYVSATKHLHMVWNGSEYLPCFRGSKSNRLGATERGNQLPT